MADYKDIDEYLVEDCQGKIKDKTWLLGLLGSVVYTPTGEKVSGGFRYFDNCLGLLLERFERLDLRGIMELPFALDDDGDPDTSDIVLDLHYTKSGSMVAMQVGQFRNSQRVSVTPTRFLEGPDAAACLAQVLELDQSN